MKWRELENNQEEKFFPPSRKFSPRYSENFEIFDFLTILLSSEF